MLTYWKIYEVVHKQLYNIIFTLDQKIVAEYENKENYVVKEFSFEPMEFYKDLRLKNGGINE